MAVGTFEIQVYKGGIWNVDSFFDDREIALSEAERLNDTGRHAGVRILEEKYDESSNIARYRVVYSKLKNSGASDDWRKQARQTSKISSSSNNRARKRTVQRKAKSQKNKGGFYMSLIVAFVILIAGVAAMIGLQEIAKFL